MIVLSRRGFLKLGAGIGVTLSLQRLSWAEGQAGAPAAVPEYRGWEDVYRQRWQWDKVARGTHTNANCVAACAWNLYVRDGVVWREEQSAPYTASNASVPDFNPRGCQKGASCANLMTGPTRVLYPLRRVGPRGGGKWERISWDEALGEIAANLVDTLARRGGGGVLCDLGVNFDYSVTLAGTMRFFRQIGAPIADPSAHAGDLALGGVITLGAGWTGGSSDDWFRSSYVVLWAINPVVTRIPDAHFLTEARYRGAQVVTIAPDFNQSAIHSDLWISPKPGTDAALALAACQVIVEENLLQADYVRKQTDLPFLVRNDNQQLLRESDVVPGGRDDRFAFWDEAKNALVWAPGTKGSAQRTLTLPDGVRPALDTRTEVPLASGKRVPVRTVFSLLRERLQKLRPEEAARITGVSAEVIRRFARGFAKAPAALILSGLGGCKNYHADLIQRSQILLASLTGNLGRPGGGWHTSGWIDLEGIALVGLLDHLDEATMAALAAAMAANPAAAEAEGSAGYISSTLFHTVHGGLAEARLKPQYGDPALPRPPKAYLDEALKKGHFPIGVPQTSEPPEVIISILGNILRHTRMGQRVRETLFTKARLIVDIGFRLSETARHADIVLPAAGWYEKVGLKYMIGLVPYITLGDRATPPLGEAKPEWEIYSLIAQRVAAEAKKRGIAEIASFRGRPCDIATLDARFSDNGRFGPAAEEDVLRFILSTSSAAAGITLDDLRHQGGAVRVRSLGPDLSTTSNFYSTYREDEPVATLRDFVEKDRPYKTLSGRQQFYVDHPWFIEVGEQLPTHKDPPTAGGNHPFTLTNGHTRWSIHAIWRDHPMMLRLQRGEPVVFINSEDARERGIGDHDLVRVSNDLGSFVARAMPTGTIHPKQVHLYHAWEPFQFHEGRSHQSIVPSPIKPTQLVGDYGHLKWGFAYWEPNAVDRDTRVNIAKL
ncbi:MAG: molybdopterin-dependent oxidoreductase [Candidatus Binatia bacterium]